MEVVFFLAAVLIVGALLFAAITFTRDRSGLDVEKYRTQWAVVEQKLSKDSEASHQLCVLEADKLLDQALREKGARGNTMGERMKSTKWSDANAVWSAHKLRNQIAHETNVKLDYNSARRALAGFKRGLKDIGAI